MADPAVDVIYIATPHAFHLDNARLCFEAGKHVLCEKPVTLDTADAEEMVRLAGEHDRFLMEAMWTACHPVIRELRTRLASGEFGRPRHLHAELGFRVDAGPDDRMLDPALGASALLDMGIYPLTIAHLLLGEAEQLTATADLSDRGIDLDIAIAGRYPGGRPGDDDRLDDVVLLPQGRDRHRPRPPRLRRLPPPAEGRLHAVRRGRAAGSSSPVSRWRCWARSR